MEALSKMVDRPQVKSEVFTFVHNYRIVDSVADSIDV